MRTRGDYESVLNQDDDSRKMAYIKGGKPRYETSGIWIRRELVNKQKLKKNKPKLKKLILTPLTPSYAHGVLQCSGRPPVLLRFFMRTQGVKTIEDDD
jgi:hypothetical protein